MRGHPPANGYWNGNPYTVVAMFASRPAEDLDFVKETGTAAASADVPTLLSPTGWGLVVTIASQKKENQPGRGPNDL